MRAAIQTADGKAEEEPVCEATGDDDNAASRCLGGDPRRRRSTGHALAFGVVISRK